MQNTGPQEGWYHHYLCLNSHWWFISSWSSLRCHGCQPASRYLQHLAARNHSLAMLSVKTCILLCAVWPFQLLKSVLTVEKHWTITPASPSPYHSWFQALDIPSAVSFWGWRALSLFNNSSYRSLLIVLAIFIFTEWCNLYPPVSFYHYLLCSISNSTTSFQVWQRGWRYSCMFKIYLEWIYIARLWLFFFLFCTLLFLINANIQFQRWFGVC